jgi:hypothetical protein
MRAVLLLAGAVVLSGTLWWLARFAGLGEGAGATEVAACGPSPAESPYPGMVLVPAASFTMGAANAFPEEGPASQQSVDGFWMDRTEVTNAHFAEFVAATGYRTPAERGWWIATSIAAGISEEISWRGVQWVLLTRLSGNAWIAAALCIVMFAVAHSLQGIRSVGIILAFAAAFPPLHPPRATISLPHHVPLAARGAVRL